MKLAAFPYNDILGNGTPCFQINDDEFIKCACSYSKNEYIHKYSQTKNKWSKWLAFPKERSKQKNIVMTYDASSKKCYIFSDMMAELDISMDNPQINKLKEHWMVRTSNLS